MRARTVSKALFLFAPAVLGLVLSLPGCTGSGEEGGGGYPDRSLETFRQLDREAIKLNMTEEEVRKVLGPPDEAESRRADIRILLYGIIDRSFPPEVLATGGYYVYLKKGRVVDKRFDWGF